MLPVLNSFSDQDSRVRYYACEALYNIAKVRFDLYDYNEIVPLDVSWALYIIFCRWPDAQVVREDFIIFFNQIFDALSKLSADSNADVQNAAHLLDRLVKVDD